MSRDVVCVELAKAVKTAEYSYPRQAADLKKVSFFLSFFPNTSFTYNPYPSSLFRNSLSFCNTSSSNLSTPYLNASLRCFTSRARSLSSPVSMRLFLELAAAAADDEEGLEMRPCCSSERALSVSMRRSWRSICASARERRRAMCGPISSRREASAAARVGWGTSS